MTTTVRTEAGPRSAAPVALLSVSSALVGALSYACSLVLAHLLMPAGFAEFAAAAALVGTAGVASAALVPLPLATRVRAHAAGTAGRTDAVTFATMVALIAGLALAALLAAVTATFAGGDTVLAVAVSALSLVAIAPVWGVLQGEARFGAYATLTVVEVAVRLGVSAVAALAGAGASGALWGYVAGAAVVLLAAGAGPARQLSHDLRRWAGVLTERARWAEVGSVAAVQVVLAAMMCADAVVVAALAAAPGADTVAAAGYQAVATLAKAPIYLAVASALVSFPALRAAPPNARAGLTVAALRSFTSMLVPAVAVVATLPAAWALLVLPAGYAGALALLPWLTVGGAGLAAATVAAMLLLANGRHRALTVGLTVAVGALAAGLAVGAGAGPAGVAAGTAAGALAGAAVLLVAGRATFAAALPRVRPLIAALLLAVAMLVCLVLLRPYPLVWTLVAALLGAAVVGLPVAAGRARARVAAVSSTSLRVLRSAGEVRRPRPRHRCTAPGTGLHVLHLGFEDPAMPGSGGGSLRTHEIGARLAAAGHRVTVLATRFPGAQDRSERHGTGSLTWIHIGPCFWGLGSGTSRLSRLLGYVAAAPVYVRAVAADLVVEDFCAPFSSMGVPWWSTRPTIGVVQWLNAREKAREYHVPVHLVERLGVRSHRILIAMSQGVADRLHAMAPRAKVRVIGNGVDPVAATVAARTDGVDIVFVGRLEIAQKGLDLLLDAWATACEEVEGDLVIVGTGPDETALRERAQRLGVAGRVRFAGRIDGRAKFELLAAARLVAMPSRFETFGIVAAEALAVGTPVLAFDIECLREVVPTDCGVLVPLSGDHQLDVEAYSAELVALHRDTVRLDQAVLCGPLAAEPHNWAVLARAQETVYRAAVGEAR